MLFSDQGETGLLVVENDFGVVLDRYGKLGADLAVDSLGDLGRNSALRNPDGHSHQVASVRRGKRVVLEATT